MIKREAAFCTELGKWWLNVGSSTLPIADYIIEAKVSVDYRPFNFKSGLKPHQLPTLLAYKRQPMYWKISDLDTISTKHYDMNWSHPLVTIPFFAFKWVRPANKTFYLIDPITIEGLMDDGKKSLTEDMARKIAVHTCEHR